MRTLRTHYHPDVININELSRFQRLSTRSIVLREELILLLFTERYQDYSLPGGGLGPGEDLIVGMKRELSEETGARNISNVTPFGIYEEYRPWYKEDFDVVHMLSYCYTCNIDRVLRETNLENYEHDNGMSPVWINIHEAIQHNIDTMSSSENKGLSIERETFLLKLIVQELLEA